MVQLTAIHWQREYSYLPAALVAVLVVFSLLLGMQAMINVDLGEPDPVVTFKQVNIWQEDPPPPLPPEVFPKPDDPVAPPEIPAQTNTFDSGGITIDELAPAPVQPLDRGIGGLVTDGSAVPLVYVQPDYPRRAAERGIEGYCVVSFIITTTGTTRDVVAEECSNSVFASASVRAASRLKYQPKTFNGRPIEAEHKFKYSFSLDQ